MNTTMPLFPVPRGHWVPAVVLLAALSLMGSPSTASADLLIIVHPALSGEAIAGKDLQRIFLGKKTIWRDEATLVPVMMKEGPLHDEFVEDYLDRSVSRFVTYWRQMVFTGKGIPPRSFATEAELVEFVSRTPGAVGFASPGADVQSVKVLAVQ